MKILVTGSGGFIGGAVRRAAEANGHEVEGFDRQHGRDVTEPEQCLSVWKLAEPDAVIHLAGVLGTDELFDNPYDAVDVNVTGTLNVLNACRVGRVPVYVGISMPDVFPSLYTATKVCAERMARAYEHAHGLRVGHVVAYNAFGIGQAWGEGHPQKIIPTFATELAQGRPAPVWGSGNQTVSLVHVDDIGRMMVEMAERLNAGDRAPKWHAGPRETFKVVDVVRMVAEDLDLDSFDIRYLKMRRGEVESDLTPPPVDDWSGLPARFGPSRLCVFRREQLTETVQWYRDQVK